MSKAPRVGESRFLYVDLGLFSFSKQGFKITLHERFNLPQ